MNNIKATDPEPISPLQAALDRLNFVMAENVDAIDTLEQKLSPVLATWAEDGSEGDTVESVSTNSSLVNELNNFADRVKNRTTSIRTLISRLDT